MNNIKDRLEISNILEQEDFPVTVLMKKWRNLRDTYVRIKGELESYIPSGSAASKKRKRKWEFYDLMSFLNETIKYKPTVSNISRTAPQDIQPGSPEMLSHCESMTSNLQKEVNLHTPSTSKGPRIGRSQKIVDEAIVQALNRVNALVAEVPLTPPVNATCQTISELLGKMPAKERIALEIQSLQHAYEGAQHFL